MKLHKRLGLILAVTIISTNLPVLATEVQENNEVVQVNQLISANTTTPASISIFPTANFFPEGNLNQRGYELINKETGITLVDGDGNIFTPEGKLVVTSDGSFVSPYTGEKLMDKEGNIYDKEGNKIITPEGTVDIDKAVIKEHQENGVFEVISLIDNKERFQANTQDNVWILWDSKGNGFEVHQFINENETTYTIRFETENPLFKGFMFRKSTLGWNDCFIGTSQGMQYAFGSSKDNFEYSEAITELIKEGERKLTLPDFRACVPDTKMMPNQNQLRDRATQKVLADEKGNIYNLQGKVIADANKAIYSPYTGQKLVDSEGNILNKVGVKIIAPDGTINEEKVAIRYEVLSNANRILTVYDKEDESKVYFEEVLYVNGDNLFKAWHFWDGRNEPIVAFAHPNTDGEVYTYIDFGDVSLKHLKEWSIYTCSGNKDWIFWTKPS